MANNALTGSLPDDWSRLGRLKTLVLFNNRLTGTVPTSWGVLRGVKAMQLYGNAGLTGCMPVGLGKVLNDANTCSDTGLTCTLCGPTIGPGAGTTAGIGYNPGGGTQWDDPVADVVEAAQADDPGYYYDN